MALGAVDQNPTRQGRPRIHKVDGRCCSWAIGADLRSFPREAGLKRGSKKRLQNPHTFEEWLQGAMFRTLAHDLSVIANRLSYTEQALRKLSGESPVEVNIALDRLFGAIASIRGASEWAMSQSSASPARRPARRRPALNRFTKKALAESRRKRK